MTCLCLILCRLPSTQRGYISLPSQVSWQLFIEEIFTFVMNLYMGTLWQYLLSFFCSVVLPALISYSTLCYRLNMFHMILLQPRLGGRWTPPASSWRTSPARRLPASRRRTPTPAPPPREPRMTPRRGGGRGPCELAPPPGAASLWGAIIFTLHVFTRQSNTEENFMFLRIRCLVWFPSLESRRGFPSDWYISCLCLLYWRMGLLLLHYNTIHAFHSVYFQWKIVPQFRGSCHRQKSAQFWFGWKVSSFVLLRRHNKHFEQQQDKCLTETMQFRTKMVLE